MGTIAENLLALQTAKENIKTAIESKGQDLTDVPFTQYPEKISAIQTGGGTDMLQARVDYTKSCYRMFADIETVETIPDAWIKNLDTSQCTNLNNMFSSCIKLIEAPMLNTSSAKTMLYIFSSCEKLKNGPLYNTSQCTNLSYMFNNCNALEEVPLYDTSQCTNLSYMFNNCRALKTTPAFNTSLCTNLSNMLYWCLLITEIPALDTRNCTDFSNMVRYCRALTTVTELDLIKGSKFSNMFEGCTNLTNLTLKNIKKTLQIGGSTSWGTLLTNESLINTIKELWDLTGSSSQTLTMSTTSKENIANIYVKLIDVTDEMRAEDEYIDNKKPCVVCESTDEGAMTLTEYAISKNWAIA